MLPVYGRMTKPVLGIVGASSVVVTRQEWLFTIIESVRINDVFNVKLCC